MSEQEVTYSTVRFHKSSELQNQVRPEDIQEPREAGHRECSVPWHLIVIAFGILCSLLLVTVAVLVTNIFQCRKEKHEPQETLNCHHNCSTMQRDIDLQKEMLRSKTIECSPGNELLESLSREQNRWYSETKTVLNSSHHTGSEVEIHWFCYGIKCYYFIKDRKTWHGCQQTCQNYRLSLLKIDDEDEWFLQLQVIPDNYWIGLKYDQKKGEWTWIDNVPSKFALNTRKYNVKDGGCLFLSKTKLDNIDCFKLYSCICGKRLDKFPD
ncbi:killer cell lectin-like receptor 7 isoform X2 [Grammomys surdaster]|uniref:killer cell lectin-like receptor 7 isoform X2 n=1 Tax=Grammomys surdaster TaxID=491861 RepID=UPI0010A08B13|nr:killer cell lectin-like receptor 7 isoform X2 [Grammomys surdaster]